MEISNSVTFELNQQIHSQTSRNSSLSIIIASENRQRRLDYSDPSRLFLQVPYSYQHFVCLVDLDIFENHFIWKYFDRSTIRNIL